MHEARRFAQYDEFMKISIPILLSFLALVLITSCAKKESPDTPANRILGKWKLVKTATDDNGNGQIDDVEIHPVPAIVDNEKVFNKDGTGVETNVYNGVTTLPLNFSWKIVGKDSVWVGYVANDTITYYLSTVSSANLTLTTNTQFGLAWYYYDKK